MPGKSYILVAVLILTSGCSWLRARTETSPRTVEPLVKNGVIFQRDLLRSGEKIIIAPFLPGPGVAADREFDRVALSLVKALHDEIDSDEHYQVVFEDQAYGADLILNGRIVRMQEPSKIRKWTFRDTGRILTVEGKAVDVAHGHTVLTFTHEVKATDPAQTFEDLAALAGQAIGKFILSESAP